MIKFPRRLHDLEPLFNPDLLKEQRFEDLTTDSLKKLPSGTLRQLYKNKINELVEKLLKTRHDLINEKVSRYEQSEVKQLTKALTRFYNQCKNKGISVKELEDESVKFITDKFKRFFFKSKWAERLYNINNCVASTSLGYWGFRAVGVLGATNRFSLPTEIGKSILPILYFTGVTCKFWSYITIACPPISKTFDRVSRVTLSPIWFMEYCINKITGPIFKASPLKTEIPLNLVGEITDGSGLTWDKLSHTYEFVQKMTKNWDKNWDWQLDVDTF
uniref:Uncharacterized protein n=1 Tax=Amicula sp. isolate GU52X-4 cfCalB7 TaxID=3003489 RepID=A0A9E8YZB2_9STRA|nr:hypothetical protein [Amicula sp. isolate GU52X-4 cfCalB7]